jgi:hypothetical protein
MTEKESLNRNFVASFNLLGQSLDLVIVSKKRAENLHLFFSLAMHLQNLFV